MERGATRGVGWLAFPMAAVLAACSSPRGIKVDGGPVTSDGAGGAEGGVIDTPVGGPDAADAPDAGDLAAVDGADAFPDIRYVDAAPSRIWTDASTAIDVQCFGYHEGRMRFRARRDQLSADQVSTLENVTLLNGPLGGCVTDVLSCTIAISGGDAGVSTYVTYDFDTICGAPSANLVANATFRPFASTLPCRYGFEGMQVLGGSPPPFEPDESCFNGIREIGNVVRDPVLAVSEAGVARHVEVGGCTSAPVQGPLALDILSEDGTSVAQGATVPAPNPDQICLRADHTFAAAGNYRLHLSVSGVDGGNSITPSLGLFYRFF